MQRPRTRSTLAIVSLALFIVVLDTLIVTVALPSIRRDLGASLQQLEWTVNAYTLAFAVTLIPGAAIGDRFGRKRTFLAGLALFTASSAAAALAPGAGALVAARALQGVGGAIVAPLTLTLLAEAFPADRRGAALGIWSGISGMGIAIGPLVGGAVVSGLSWQCIFWINVPLGLALLPLAAVLLNESHGPSRRLHLPGIALVTTRPFRLGPRLRPRRRPGRGLGERADRREPDRRRDPARRVRRLGAARGAAHAAGRPVRPPRVRRHERGVVLHVLRDVRLDLPHHPVHPAGDGLRPVRRRRANARLDRRDRGREPDRRPPGRAARPARADGRGARAAGRGAGVAGGGGDDDLPELAPLPAVRPRRRRHGPRLRALGERAAQRGRAGAGRAGVGDEQRDPRGRRRVRRRRDVDDLRRRRQLHLAAGVRGRLHA